MHWHDTKWLNIISKTKYYWTILLSCICLHAPTGYRISQRNTTRVTRKILRDTIPYLGGNSVKICQVCSQNFSHCLLKFILCFVKIDEVSYRIKFILIYVFWRPETVWQSIYYIFYSSPAVHPIHHPVTQLQHQHYLLT